MRTPTEPSSSISRSCSSYFPKLRKPHKCHHPSQHCGSGCCKQNCWHEPHPAFGGHAALAGAGLCLCMWCHSSNTSTGQLVSQKKQQPYLSRPVALSEDSVRSRAKTCSSSCVESETRMHTGSSIRTTIPVWPSCCPLFTFTWSPGCSSTTRVSKFQLLLAPISQHTEMLLSQLGMQVAARA